jgi:glucosylceramidase
MELLFGETGLGYSLGRVHINSCDFSVESYTFDDVDGDFELDEFDVGVHHDAASGMIEMALRATSVLKQAWGDENDSDSTDGISYVRFSLVHLPG